MRRLKFKSSRDALFAFAKRLETKWTLKYASFEIFLLDTISSFLKQVFTIEIFRMTHIKIEKQRKHVRISFVTVLKTQTRDI